MTSLGAFFGFIATLRIPTAVYFKGIWDGTRLLAHNQNTIRKFSCEQLIKVLSPNIMSACTIKARDPEGSRHLYPGFLLLGCVCYCACPQELVPLLCFSSLFPLKWLTFMIYDNLYELMPGFGKAPRNLG